MTPSDTQVIDPDRTAAVQLADIESSSAPIIVTRHITVAELATAIYRTVGTTRKLLDKDYIPGAERKTPGEKNSPWLIPSTSPARFLAGEGRP